MNVETVNTSLPLSVLVASPLNPRDELTGLDELAKSIKLYGVLQPVVVEPHTDEGFYRILAGHRRAAAAKLAGLAEVPAVLRSPATESVQAIHLVENIQRQDLTPLEIGISVYTQLEAGMKQKDLAEALSKPKTWVSKFSTIGEAYAHLIEQDRDTGKMAAEGNYSKLYELARKILGLDTKPTKAGMKDGQDEGEEDDGDLTEDQKMEAAAQEAREKLEQLADAVLARFGGKVAVELDGKSGFAIRWTFKNETKLTDAVQGIEKFVVIE